MEQNDFKLRKLEILERITAADSKEFIEEIEEFLSLKELDKAKNEMETQIVNV